MLNATDKAQIQKRAFLDSFAGSSYRNNETTSGTHFGKILQSPSSTNYN
jgi:hypothetical protein